MLDLVERRARREIADTVILLEHRSVITRGKGLQRPPGSSLRHVPFSRGIPAHVDYVEVERGGDLTLHNPGQLVIYPIVKLDGSGWGPSRDVVGFLRKLERTMGAVVQTWVPREPSYRTDATGVWVDDKKIASIGVAVRKWVTYHGVALNCVNDLSDFSMISPCGYSPEVMTSVERLAPGMLELQSWRDSVESRVKDAFLEARTG